ncbi:MAG: AAA family ATPase [Clostridia bacterium]|nr:AAA family ATPase [Clostridia bacterium]
MTKKFGLIGKTLKHSFSKPIHSLLGDYSYELYEIKPEDIKEFVLSGKLDGFNVTIPYKKDVIPYLDYVDERAKAIGAVNTVMYRNGKILGFNTDFDGMKYMLDRAGIVVKDKNVLILGSGGTSATARAVATSLGAKSVKILSRTGEINYDNYKDTAKESEVVINTTPVGMYPNNYECKIDLSAFSMLTGVADAVYNPALTKLLYQAKQRGVAYSNGLPMLVAQAKYAMEKFLDVCVSQEVIEPIVKKLSSDMQNVVLIGMPGCGKSTIGKAVASTLNREFIDTDQEIIKKAGMEIAEIFATKGEEEFRKLESEVLREVGLTTGKVIATGGGVIKNRENYFPLKSNGKIFWIQRSVEKLVAEGRPLSKDRQTVEKLYLERKENYEYFADKKIDNNSELELAVKGVLENL